MKEAKEHALKEFSLTETRAKLRKLADFLITVEPIPDGDDEFVSEVCGLSFQGLPTILRVSAVDSDDKPTFTIDQAESVTFVCSDEETNTSFLAITCSNDTIAIALFSNPGISWGDLDTKRKIPYTFTHGQIYSYRELKPLEKALYALTKIANPKDIWVSHAENLGLPEVPEQWISYIDETMIPIEDSDDDSLAIAYSPQTESEQREWVEYVLEVDDPGVIFTWFPSFLRGLKGDQLSTLLQYLDFEGEHSLAALSEELFETKDMKEAKLCMVDYLVLQFMSDWVLFQNILNAYHLPGCELNDESDEEYLSGENTLVLCSDRELRAEIDTIRMAFAELDEDVDKDHLLLLFDKWLEKAKKQQGQIEAESGDFSMTENKLLGLTSSALYWGRAVDVWGCLLDYYRQNSGGVGVDEN